MTDKTETGVVLVALVTLLIPMVMIVGAFTTAMNGRTSQLVTEMDRERALLAAESGVDDAIFEGRIGALKDNQPYERSLAGGLSFRVEPTYLRTDSLDNDNDSNIDEADEDVFQVVVTGRYRNTTRRLAAYLGPVGLLPDMESAVTVQNDDIDIELNGTPLISGFDVKMNGSPGSNDKPALSITPPGTVADLSDELSPSEASNVVGPGGPPSLGTSAATDLSGIVAEVQNTANVVLTSNKYSSYSFGNGPAGDPRIAYRNGDVAFKGNTQGAGILVVTGDLTLGGNFRFDGVIIVLGDLINAAGTARIYGGVVLGPSSGLFEIRGTMEVHYSSEAIALANSTGGQYVSFNGWQELAR